MNFNCNYLKIQKLIFGQKFFKKLGVPLTFFPIFDQKIIFEFSRYYD